MDSVITPQPTAQNPYNSFRSFQKTLKSIAKLIPKKLPKLRTQKKELHRKENLKKMYFVHMQQLNLVPSTCDFPRIPYQQSETQIRFLLNHQFSYLVELESQSSRTSVPRTAYRNPLALKLKTVFDKESKLFRPSFNKCLVKSLFFHDESLALAHRAGVEQEVEKHLEILTSGKVNSLINKQRKMCENYRKSYEKLCSRLKQQSLLHTKPAAPKLTINLSPKHLFQSPLKSCRSCVSAEDSISASTSRSSSANQRLGFFMSTVNY